MLHDELIYIMITLENVAIRCLSKIGIEVDSLGALHCARNESQIPCELR